MLTTDLALRYDPIYGPISKKFMEDPKAFEEAFAKAKAEGHGPRRSILFLAVCGEEKGLLGSEWYSESPIGDRHLRVM
jgi:Zn-dependent M28 family amino/carboxypeptidase